MHRGDFEEDRDVVGNRRIQQCGCDRGTIRFGHGYLDTDDVQISVIHGTADGFAELLEMTRRGETHRHRRFGCSRAGEGGDGADSTYRSDERPDVVGVGGIEMGAMGWDRTVGWGVSWGNSAASSNNRLKIMCATAAFPPNSTHRWNRRRLGPPHRVPVAGTCPP